ncbi:NAD(P)-binding domain-containing protein [soil metagenome]
MTTIGIIGVGLMGSEIARSCVVNGYDVVVANSRGPETLAELVDELGGRARAATVADAAKASDIIAMTIPLIGVYSLPPEPFAGKVVIDGNNYYRKRDGEIEELWNETTTVSEVLQEQLPEAYVVKGLNHLHPTQIARERHHPGGVRQATALAGDDDEAKKVATEFFDTIGFDVLDLGPLSEGWRVQRGTPAYGPRFTIEELRVAAAVATRFRDR